MTELGVKFEVKPSTDMERTDLSRYGFVIIPGAQWQDDYYVQYMANAARFDSYVTNGGVLVLELNGAERDGICTASRTAVQRAIGGGRCESGNPLRYCGL